ncbi:major facilitator superfamily domain-containing protein [Podospora appendiculata]|uniref:Major facilitator superfamily domain-containing protein n=1 Tax=Podospora appendiculata TaxID=314037 RepID=A0AAE0XD81_9PEZI|nr:major facilitator superfamily domain-containing protein [Podospora appendiculata]
MARSQENSRTPRGDESESTQPTCAENGHELQRFNLDDDTDVAPRSRHWRLDHKRTLVLVGSAILQLPIWGFVMCYGVFQEHYSANWALAGSREVTGIIGTTSNGVIYLSMPFLFALFTKRLAHWRQTAALCGAALACLSFVLSSFSTHVWHLVATQGVLSALGCALVYSPTTLSLGEWFGTRNRAVAYGVVLSCKNIVGSACPFLMRVMLDRYGFRGTTRLWTAVTAAASVAGILLIPTPPATLAPARRGVHSRPVRIPWHFLRHQTFYVYAAAIVFQTAGYGIPQTYLNTYAAEVTMLSQTSATLLLTLFNIPGILSSSFFGYLSDNKRFPLSATAVTAISAAGSALAAFLFWGLTSRGSMALLVLFSVTFGFFAGGYSATWGGVVNELESEAAGRNEAIDTGVVYGLLNGARGVGLEPKDFVDAGLPADKVVYEMSAKKGAYNAIFGQPTGTLIGSTGTDRGHSGMLPHL